MIWDNIFARFNGVLTNEALSTIAFYRDSQELFYKMNSFSQSLFNDVYQMMKMEIQSDTQGYGEYNKGELSRIICRYLLAKSSIEDDRRNEIVKSLFYIEKMGLYSVDPYALGVVAKKAGFLYDYTYYGGGSYEWTIAKWLGKNISGQLKELNANEKMNEDRMLSEVIKALDDNVDKQLTVDEFSPIKCSIIQAHIQHFGIKPITQRKERWEGYSAKTVNMLLSDLDLNFTTTKSKKLWSIHKKSTENETSKS